MDELTKKAHMIEELWATNDLDEDQAMTLAPGGARGRPRLQAGAGSAEIRS